MRACRQISPGTKIFLQNVFHTKATPLFGAETIFGQVFVRGGMTKFSKWKVPPTGGQAGTTRDCCAPRRLIARSFELLAPLRCAGPCQFRCRATWQPSRYPSPSQAPKRGEPSCQVRCLLARLARSGCAHFFRSVQGRTPMPVTLLYGRERARVARPQLR